MDYNKLSLPSTRHLKQARYTISEYDKRPGPPPTYPHKVPRMTMDETMRRHLPPPPHSPPLPTSSQEHQRTSQQQSQTAHSSQQPLSQQPHSSQQYNEATSQTRRSTMGRLGAKLKLESGDFKLFKSGGDISRPTNKIRDTREFRNQDFQRHAIRVIIEYLNKCQYGPITSKTLRGLNAKELENIFKFLFLRITSDHEFGPKFEEEFFGLLRIIRYPFVESISPKSLYSIAAPHSLPRYLALLSWMVEQCIINDKKDHEKRTQHIIDTTKGMTSAQMEHLFQDYSMAKYGGFLQGNGGQDVYDELEAVFKGIQKSNMDQHDSILAEKELCLEEEANLIRQLEAHEQADQRMKKTEERIAASSTDTTTIQQKIDKYTSNNQKVEKDIDYLINYHEQLQREKEQLKGSITDFDVTDEEIQKRMKQQSDLDMDIDNRRQLLDELRQNTWELDTQVQQKRHDIERLVASYNELIKSTDHLPLKDADIDTRLLTELLVFDPDATDLEGMVIPHIEKDTIPAMQHSLQTLKQSLSDLQKYKSQIQSEQQSKQDQLQQEQQDRKHLEGDYTKKKQQLNLETTEIKDELSTYNDAKGQMSRATDKLKRDSLIELVEARSTQKITQLELESRKMAITNLKSNLEKKLSKIVSELDATSSYIPSRIVETTKEFDQLFPMDLDLDLDLHSS